jgi:3-oxoadipate enol-lactonase
MNSFFSSIQIELNGNIISYNDCGNKDAIPIIFIHDLGLNQTMWKHQIDHFKNNFRVITYDVRGHGSSGYGDGHYTIDLFADDLISLMDHLKIPKAVLCGYSMGGFIALRTIEIYTERVMGLVLCETNSYADSNEEKTNRFKSIMSIKINGVTDYANTLINQRLHTAENQKPELESMIKNAIENTSAEGLCGTLLAVASRTDTSKYLKEIKVPTIIIEGEKDSSHPFDALYLNHFITGSQLKTIKGAWNFSNIEKPDEFNAVLVEFINHRFLHNPASKAGTTIMLV